jgi:polar amino acid transport system substrate-binding protein
MMRFAPHCLSVSIALLLAIVPAAHAACSRPIQVAVSPTGHSAIIKGNVYTGVYPEILKSIQAKGGCKFVFSTVPRARQQAMFLAGDADFLFPANRTPLRDLTGHFVPMVSSRAAIMTIDPKFDAFHSLAQLRARKELRVALVRGYDYGDAYRALAQDLTNEQRVFLEADAIGVARLLKAGFADVTIMSPSLFNSAITTDSRVSDIAPKLRIDPVDDLPWTENGVYLSTKSLSQADRNELDAQLSAAVRSGKVWEAYQRFYPIEVLKNSIRPL